MNENICLHCCSPQTGELDAALAKAQGAFPVIEKTRTVRVPGKDGKSGYEFDYAPLDEIIDATRPHLTANGLCVRQLVTTQPGAVSVTTKLSHASGQYEQTTMSWPAGGSRIQDMGGIVTYLRRYALTGILNVAADTDDDASGGEGAQVTQRTKKPNCPQCGKGEFVLEDKQEAGKFFCWKNADRGKLGCGHKWSAVPAKVAEEIAAGTNLTVASASEKQMQERADKVNLWKSEIEEYSEAGTLDEFNAMFARFQAEVPGRDLARSPIARAIVAVAEARGWKYDKEANVYAPRAGKKAEVAA